MDFLAKNFRGVLLCFALALPASYLGKMFPVVGAPVFAILFRFCYNTNKEGVPPAACGVSRTAWPGPGIRFG